MASRGKIIIGKPTVVELGDRCRLQSKIEFRGTHYEIYYEYDSEYLEWLVADRCDAFLLLMYGAALYEGADVICEAPVTKQLYYQITSYLMPMMSKYIDEYHMLNIEADLAPEVPSSNLENTAALFSGGVDSFYTLLGRIESGNAFNPITHLVFNNLGALTKDLQTARLLFAEKVEKIEEIARSFDVKLLAVDSNILEISSQLPEVISSPDMYKNAGAIYGVKKLFGTCYWSSSGCGVSNLNVTLNDMAQYDFFNTSLVSVRDLRFYLMDITASRMDKVRFIADNDIVKTSLQVCHGDNDSKCFKCSRTLAELYALGKLDEYTEVFDIPWYKEHFNDRLGYTLGDKNEWSHGYCQETLEAAKANGVPIPVGAWVLAWLKWRPILFLKRTFKGSSFLRKFYERFDVRHKLNFE